MYRNSVSPYLQDQSLQFIRDLQHQDDLGESRTGVFLWCVTIADFIFRETLILEIIPASWLVNWGFCVTREESELLTDFRDFTTLFHVIVRRKWLESFVESYFWGLRYGALT